MKIDIFPHLFPHSYYERMLTVNETAAKYHKRRATALPMLVDLEMRFKLMDQHPGYQQFLTVAGPGIEIFCDPKDSPELARLANDGMAELCAKHPDRFIGFAASLPMNNMDACLQEVDRAIQKLGARGVQIFTNVKGRPLDEVEFRPLFQKMAAYDFPIWLHPARPSTFPDYQTESHSLYELWWVFGWPYESSIAMARLVFTGIFDELPNLKIITHHLGAMIPYFEGRIGPGLDQLGSRTPEPEKHLVKHHLQHRPLDYFRKFYADTAVYGPGPMECGLAFFGVDHVLYGSDMPFDPEGGYFNVRETMRSLDACSISPADRQKIYETNARGLLRLPGTAK
ncbi:MAG: amidohydrolase [Acidobacteria bacterium]|nr:amidohydrolase [Acidobacteriota bacterium]